MKVQQSVYQNKIRFILLVWRSFEIRKKKKKFCCSEKYLACAEGELPKYREITKNDEVLD